jgi:hypothetical protein
MTSLTNDAAFIMFIFIFFMGGINRCVQNYGKILMK